MPEDIENAFWNIFFSHLRGSIPPSMVIELPDPASLAASLTRGAVVPVAAQQVATVPTIHLVGNSMSSRVAGPLQVYLEDEFQVNAVIFTGGPWEQARLDIPVLKDGRDVLVLNVLGNQIFKGRHYSAQGKIHLEDPDYLSDQELATLVDKLVNTIKKIAQVFKGDIKILGPFPRHLSKCCKNNRHTLPKSPFFDSSLHYVDMLNRFLWMLPKLRG